MRHVLAYEAMAAPDATGYVECSGQEVTRGAMADVLQPYDVEALLEAISSIPGWGINSVKLNCAVKTKGPIQQIPAWSFHDAGMLTSVYYRIHFGRRVREGNRLRGYYDIFMTVTRDADNYHHVKVQYWAWRHIGGPRSHRGLSH